MIKKRLFFRLLVIIQAKIDIILNKVLLLLLK